MSNLNPFQLIEENNLEKLKKLYNYNKYILTQKDEHLNTLLHYAVKCNNYEITKFLLEKGINYDEPNDEALTALHYSSGEVKKLLSSYGAFATFYCSRLFPTKGIFINEKDKNKIELIYKQFLNNGLVSEMNLIKKDNRIIGKRLIRKISKETYSWLSEDQIPVYHGTRFVSIENIMYTGLKKVGEPLKGHISLGNTVDNVEDWANAIFVTPSIFYASQYAEIIYSDGEEWFIIIEARLNNKCAYSKHSSTFYGYKYKQNEPEKIEYRIGGFYELGDIMYWHYNESESVICTTSLLFVNKNYLEKIQNYDEGKIFENNTIKFADSV
jgi:hypothetical protein